MNALNEAALDMMPEGSDLLPGYYDLGPILEKNAVYNVIIGQRGNGKTYSVLLYALERYVKSSYKEQLGIIRRWAEDLRSFRASQLFAAIVADGHVKRLTKGKWENITFTNGKWYLSRFDNKLGREVCHNLPFAFAFSLSTMEHDKSISYPGITTVLFDEFLTRNYYLPDEFITFTNVISTIARGRNNVTIFMCGNTVSKYSDYFTNMGLTKVHQMKQGTIDIYRFGKSHKIKRPKVAVEYCAKTAVTEPANQYFAFDNPNLKMITEGDWELVIYPPLQVHYEKKDVLFTYFIEWGGKYLQCEIVSKDGYFFTYIHTKTSELKHPDTDLVYSLEHSEKTNYRRRLLSQATPMEARIAWFYGVEKVFFQNNEIGEIVRNYILKSTQSMFAKTNKY